jgi:hypothetical protein
MEDKARAGGIIIGIGLLLAYLLFRSKSASASPYSSAKLGNTVVQPLGPTTSTPRGSPASVKSRSIGQAILLADPTSPTGYSWTAPVGAHVELASDGTYWAVMNNSPSQNKAASASGITTGPQAQSIPATRPGAGLTYADLASGGLAPYGGVVSGTNNFPPTSGVGPSGSQTSIYNQSAALDPTIYTAEDVGYAYDPTEGGLIDPSTGAPIS